MNEEKARVMANSQPWGQARAHYPGVVVSVLPLRGVVIEFAAVGAQGIVGCGGEAGGRVRVLAEARECITAARVSPRWAGTVIIGGSIDPGGLRRAAEVGVQGIVVGSLRASVFEEALAEQHRLPIVVTEGFGQGGMAERAFDVLRQCEGLEARLAGGTLGNPTDLPEVVVPVDAPSAPRPKAPSLELGAAVRIVAGPRAFAVGTVASVGAEPRAFPGGVVDRWCAVALDDEQEVVVPRMNVELVGG